MKHKHADLIHAWADGAEIQLYSQEEGKWVGDKNPLWAEFTQYRLKPKEKKPVVRWLWADENNVISKVLFDEKEAHLYGWFIKLEWSRTEFPE